MIDVGSARARAEARFKRKEKLKDFASKTRSDVEAAKEDDCAKTARLRGLRLAKEEADRASAERIAATKASPGGRK